VTPAEFLRASVADRLKMLQLAPASVFVADRALTLAAVWRRRGRGPADACELLRAVKSVPDQAALVAQLPTATAGTVCTSRCCCCC
jgi:hypothetical protein